MVNCKRPPRSSVRRVADRHGRVARATHSPDMPGHTSMAVSFSLVSNCGWNAAAFHQPSSQRADDGLGAEVIEQGLGTEHAAAATAEVAAGVRDAVREYVVRVDPTVAGNHGFGDAVGAFKVVAPYAVGQAVGRTVHQVHGLVFLAEGHHVGDGSENFFAEAD